MTSQRRHNDDWAQNSRFSVKYRPKFENFAKKGVNIEISPGSWLKREANDISNIHSKFQDHNINKFVKMATFDFLRWQPPPPPPALPTIFDGLP